MKFNETALLGALAFSACTTEFTETPKAPTALKEPPVAAQAVSVDLPTSELSKESVDYSQPPRGMSPEAFKHLSRGIGVQFSRGYNDSWAQKTPQEKQEQKTTNELIRSFTSFLDKKDQTGEFRGLFQQTFPKGSKIDVTDLVKFLNQFFHADACHLRISKTEEGWETALYRFDDTNRVSIKDTQGSGEYPVLYITENLTGAYPDPVAEGDVKEGLIQFYSRNQDAAAQRMAREFAVYPRLQAPDAKKLLEELTKDTLHHEAVHLLLINRNRELAYWQGCVRGQLNVNMGPAVQHLQGCFTPLQVHELCGHAAEIASSDFAGPWTHMDYLGDRAPESAAQYLFLETLMPQTLATLAPEITTGLLQEAQIMGGFKAEKVKEQVGSTDYPLTSTQEVGRRGYEACLNLLGELQRQKESNQ